MKSRWTIDDVNRVNNKQSGSSTTAKVKMPAASSSALTKAALRILDLKGFHVWRQNNAGVYNNEKKVWRANSSTLGISDIIGFRRTNGQFLACEIKAGRDKLSDHQIEFLDEVKKAGGVAMVIRTMDDVEKINTIEL